MAKCEQVTALDTSFPLRGPFAGTIGSFLMRDVEKASSGPSEYPRPEPAIVLSALPAGRAGSGRVIRVVTLADRRTIHNAFADRSFTP